MRDSSIDGLPLAAAGATLAWSDQQPRWRVGGSAASDSGMAPMSVVQQVRACAFCCPSHHWRRGRQGCSGSGRPSLAPACTFCQGRLRGRGGAAPPVWAHPAAFLLPRPAPRPAERHPPSPRLMAPSRRCPWLPQLAVPTCYSSPGARMADLTACSSSVSPQHAGKLGGASPGAAEAELLLMSVAAVVLGGCLEEHHVQL